MSSSDYTSRIDALEAEVAALKSHMKTAVVLLSAKGSSPFKTPLERFFDGPDGGLFVDPVKDLKCRIQCAKDFDAMMDAAGDDKDAQDAAVDALLKCHSHCDGFPV